jgi:hypothetical protein
MPKEGGYSIGLTMHCSSVAAFSTLLVKVSHKKEENFITA